MIKTQIQVKILNKAEAISMEEESDEGQQVDEVLPEILPDESSGNCVYQELNS